MTALVAFIRSLSWPVIAMVLTFFFYEGVFFLNFWPVNQIPYAGWVFEGEISRRIEADRVTRDAKATERDVSANERISDQLSENARERATQVAERARQADFSRQREQDAIAAAEQAWADMQEALDAKDEISRKLAYTQLRAALAESCEPEKVIEYVKQSCPRCRQCVRPGGAPVNPGILREYRSITGQAR